jgi:hypothetical protein
LCDFPFQGATCTQCEEGYFTSQCLNLTAALLIVPSTGLDLGGGQVSLRGYNFDNDTAYTMRWGSGPAVERVRPCVFKVLVNKNTIRTTKGH